MKELLDKEMFTRDNIKTDSRAVGEGDIFVAIKGTVDDGHDHIKEALDKKASFVICERVPAGVEVENRQKIILVEDAREELARAAKHVFGDPSGALTVYGVTGTNGKTTTVFLIDRILESNSVSSGIISTVFNRSRGDRLERAVMTTPDLLQVNRLLSEMVSDGKKAAVVEVSSHALSQKRVSGISLDSAVFTNITPEHLDYHGDMDSYLADKSLIFGNLKPGGSAVINADDPRVAGLIKTIDLRAVVTFGIREQADVRAEDTVLRDEGSEFTLAVEGGKKVSIKSALIGQHNVYNMLASAAAVLSQGTPMDAVREGLEKSGTVPGRLDAVRSDAPFKVFVDYAHTPDALENVLGCLRPLAAGRLVCVFGCGGDRDRTKRPEMGRIAASLCEEVILTSDNPRSEDPREILKEIEKGVSDKTNYSIIEERKNAIREALSSAGDGDIVIIAGKGHEDYQIIGREVLHFDDKETAGELLVDMGY